MDNKNLKIGDLCEIVYAGTKYPKLLGEQCTITEVSTRKGAEWVIDAPSGNALYGCRRWHCLTKSLRKIDPHDGSGLTGDNPTAIVRWSKTIWQPSTIRV